MWPPLGKVSALWYDGAMFRTFPTAPVFSACLLLLLAVSLPCPADDGARTEFDRASSELAATLVLDRLAAELSEKPTDGTALYETMVGTPAAYTDPADAEKALRPTYAAAVSKRYADDAGRLLDRLAAPRARDEAFSAAFLAHALRPSADLLERAVDGHYAAAFREARERACKEQAATIASDLRPTEAEVEENSRDALTRLLAARVAEAQKTRVFQENLRYIQDSIVRPLLDEAYRQRDAQRRLASHAVVPGAAPSVLAARLVEAVEQDIAKRRAEAAPGAVVYGLFPSVRETAGKAAAKRAADAYVAAVQRAVVPIDESKVRIALAEDPARHVRKADSVQAFEPGLVSVVAETALRLALESAPPEEHAEFREFIRGLSPDSAAGKAAPEKVRRDIDPILSSVRQAVARADLAERFPELADGSWHPEPDLVDEVCRDADYHAPLREWRSLRDTRRFADCERLAPMLEETTALLDQAVAASFDDGAAARAEQHKAVDRAAPDVRKAVAAAAEPPPLEDIVRRLSDAVGADWAARRPEVVRFPEGRPDDGRYTALFPSVDEKILLLAKAMSEDAQREKERREKEEKPAPQLPPTPAAELEEVEMDCALVFGREGDRITVSVLVDGAPAGTYSCPHQPDDFRSEVAAFSNATTKAVLGAVQKAVMRNRVALRVRIAVSDPCVYYGAVSGISRGLRDAVKQFRDYVTGLDIGESDD